MRIYRLTFGNRVDGDTELAGTLDVAAKDFQDLTDKLAKRTTKLSPGLEVVLLELIAIVEED